MTMQRTIVHIGILLSFFSIQGITQTASVDPSQNILPPSPTAAAFTKYIDFPVNTSTGTPSVSVPLGVLAGKGISVPISLEYHAGGVRVDEVSSIVGLGWSLNAGGMISRSVVGLADEDGYGFMYKGNDVSNPPITTPSAHTAMQNFASGVWDGQPDIFQFNFGGYSVSLRRRASCPTHPGLLFLPHWGQPVFSRRQVSSFVASVPAVG